MKLNKIKDYQVSGNENLQIFVAVVFLELAFECVVAPILIELFSKKNLLPSNFSSEKLI